MIDFDATTLAAVQATFGEPVTLTRAADGVAQGVTGIWQDPFTRLELGDDGTPKRVTHAPTVGLRVSDLTTLPVRNDRIDHAGRRHLVVEVNPDGVGWVNLILKVAA